MKTEPGVQATWCRTSTKRPYWSGIVVRVPLFIKEGDTLKVDTRTGTYVERV
jgi:elongation factor P